MIKRSLTHLLLRSVIAAWILVFASIFTYASMNTLDNEKVHALGLRLVYDIIDHEIPINRGQRLIQIKKNYTFDLDLISKQDTEKKLNEVITAGRSYPHKVSNREHWLYMVLSDESGVLAVGPIDILSPQGFKPIGFYISVIIAPFLALLWVYRVERKVSKLEQASRAIASGELNTRLNDFDGPLRELVESFNDMAERIEQLIRSKDELIQAISHELGTPLARLRLHLSLLEESGEKDRARRYQDIRRELDELEDLLAELLSYIQSHEREVILELFNPVDILEDLSELTSLEYPTKARIKVDNELTSTKQLYADQRLFQRAIENLLRNASRHAIHHVLVEIYQDEHSVITKIHDDGSGIPADQHQRVLLPFVRLETEPHNKSNGIGLGLSIVAQIIKRHQGSIELGTSPLGGLCVTLSWPHQKK